MLSGSDLIWKSEVVYIVYHSYQIWHKHPLTPNPLSQVDILVVYAIVSNWLHLKHLITYWNPCASNWYIVCGFFELDHKIAW